MLGVILLGVVAPLESGIFQFLRIFQKKKFDVKNEIGSANSLLWEQAGVLNSTLKSVFNIFFTKWQQNV
jgi:hypothetical protein